MSKNKKGKAKRRNQVKAAGALQEEADIRLMEDIDTFPLGARPLSEWVELPASMTGMNTLRRSGTRLISGHAISVT